MKAAIQVWEDYIKVDPNSERSQRLKAQLEKMKKMADTKNKSFEFGIRKRALFCFQFGSISELRTHDYFMTPTCTL